MSAGQWLLSQAANWSSRPVADDRLIELSARNRTRTVDEVLNSTFARTPRASDSAQTRHSAGCSFHGTNFTSFVSAPLLSYKFNEERMA